MYQWEHLIISIKNAIDLFLARDMNLLELDANERTLSAKLASYISQLFPNYDVDCEYNRHGVTLRDCQHRGPIPRTILKVKPSILTLSSTLVEMIIIIYVLLN